MNNEFEHNVKDIADVDVDSLNIYDPNASNDVLPRFVINFHLSGSEKQTSFICQPVSADKVLMNICLLYTSPSPRD